MELHIHPDRDLFSGDGYGPGCSGQCYAGEGNGDNRAEAKVHEKRVEVKPSTSKTKEGGYNQKGHEAFKLKEKQVKKLTQHTLCKCVIVLLFQTCKDFNMKEGGCKFGATCKYKHACSKKLSPSRICWGSHRKVDCTERTFGAGWK